MTTLKQAAEQHQQYLKDHRLNFRVWDPAVKEMSEVLCLNYEIGCVKLSFKFCDEAGGDNYYPGFTDVEIMQSTGVYDLNGKEIFEGDICNVREYQYLKPEYRRDDRWKVVEVIWGCEDGWAYRGYYQGKGKGDYYGIRFSEVNEREVIGNIYANPELIEKP